MVYSTFPDENSSFWQKKLRTVLTSIILGRHTAIFLSPPPFMITFQAWHAFNVDYYSTELAFRLRHNKMY